MGWARANLLYDGKRFEHGSLEEAIAIEVFNRRREQRLSEAGANIAANFKSDNISEVYRELKGAIFVEMEYDSQKFMVDSQKKYKEMAEKFVKDKIRIQPVKGFGKSRTHRRGVPFKIGKPNA